MAERACEDDVYKFAIDECINGSSYEEVTRMVISKFRDFERGDYWYPTEERSVFEIVKEAHSEFTAANRHADHWDEYNY
jgi:hypothetical protein